MRQISFVSGMKTQFFPSESQSHSSGEKQTFFDLDKGVSGEWSETADRLLTDC